MTQNVHGIPSTTQALREIARYSAEPPTTTTERIFSRTRQIPSSAMAATDGL